MSGAQPPARVLHIRYGEADPVRVFDCLRAHGVTEILDMLIGGPFASCLARAVGVARPDLDELIACLRAAGADVTERPDAGPLVNGRADG